MNTDKLVENLMQKREVLSQLRQLADLQSALVGGGDSRKLLGLLATKEKLLQALKKVEASLDPFRDEDPDDRVWRSPAERQAARGIAEECNSLLAEIMEIDQSDEERLIARRDVNAEARRRVRTTKLAITAYSQPSPHHTGNLDLSSDR
jgi:hypothetical protein